MNKISNKNKIVGLLSGFHNEIKNKWLSTCSRNLNEETFGINGLFKNLKSFRSLIGVFPFLRFSFARLPFGRN